MTDDLKSGFLFSLLRDQSNLGGAVLATYNTGKCLGDLWNVFLCWRFSVVALITLSSNLSTLEQVLHLDVRSRLAVSQVLWSIALVLFEGDLKTFLLLF